MTSLIRCDKQTGETKKVETALSRDKLYVLDSFNRQLAVYNPATFELLRQTEVGAMDSDYSYLGNIIPMP